ncbi:sigma-70 family RNA polymerase sigma factor [Phytoactinopolyspora alkaliphila]|uniref:Sigma-70 family RNA polymerase sigma factor n=1 Tax=Phytoactinopolyspora alkaliphila TaxID=1783498 RepID=A0A6N9YSR8_9ACTN|nr:sigma-70 family RNA polymerase sigma factor [Phytoactinopolyspora alkaliphila]NED98083.1 sigma-70 family RNA polymerase sigma factor [Phytoactinopolyspora alkaliphila]
MSVAERGTTEHGPSDGQLWSRARRGNPAAFGELFTRHSHLVYSFCFRLTASWKTAEDLTTVVFLEAWRRRSSAAAEQDAVVPWLLGIASQVARNSTRAVRRHRHILAKLPPAVIDDGLQENPAARAESEQQMQEILRVFRRLPQREQEVLALCVWGERTAAEAAIALGIPVGTVRSRLTRAHEHLRNLAEAAAQQTKPRAAMRPQPTREAT